MSTTFRSAAVGAAASVAVGAALASVPAAQAVAANEPRSQITVRSSDYEVQPGEQFVLRGRMSVDGLPLDDARVRVQSYRDGWENLSGAVVSTNSEGRYRVRVILFAGGDRDLRVVGNPAGDDIRNSRAYTVVRVLG